VFTATVYKAATQVNCRTTDKLAILLMTQKSPWLCGIRAILLRSAVSKCFQADPHVIHYLSEDMQFLVSGFAV